MGSLTPPDAPLWVLQTSTVQALSVLLEQEKLLATEDGLLRDWRGVAELSGLAGDNIVYQRISNCRDGHFAETFSAWKKLPGASTKDLCSVLEKIDRFDVWDDVAEKVAEDVQVATETAAKKGLDLKNLAVTDLARKRIETEDDALTYEDMDCLNRGQPLPNYDAFILYSEEDSDTVADIVKNLENQGLKIVIKDRDLLGGLFEHTAVMKLISERCTKLMPFFTPTFFHSAHNQFLVDFAQWSQMETRNKISGKIIPIVSDQRCDIPANLSLYSKIKYDPNTTIYNFWERLVKNINPAITFKPELAPQPVKKSSGPFAPSLSKMSYPEKSKSDPKSEKVKSDKPEKKSSEKGKSDIKKPKLSISSKMKSTKQSFSNILVREDREKLDNEVSEPSSLESEVNGDSGALLLPDVPDHEPGGLKGWLSKLGSKSSKKSKMKYRESEQPGSSAC